MAKPWELIFWGFPISVLYQLIVEFQFTESKEAKLALLRSTLVSTQLIRY